MPFTRNPTKHANYFYNTKCPEGQAPGNSAPRQGIWGKRNNWLYSCTHTHIYFINFFFSVCTYVISTFLWLLQELLFPSRTKWMPRLSWEESSDQYMTRASITRCSTLHKFPDSEPRSQVGRDCPQGTSNRSDRSPTVWGKGEDWFRFPVLHSCKARTWSGNERGKTGLHPDLEHYGPYRQKPCWNI